jgi:hypothetical protein
MADEVVGAETVRRRPAVANLLANAIRSCRPGDWVTR